MLKSVIRMSQNEKLDHLDMVESIILPGNKNYPKLRNTCLYSNRLLYGANSLTDLFSNEGEEDCDKDSKNLGAK